MGVSRIIMQSERLNRFGLKRHPMGVSQTDTLSLPPRLAAPPAAKKEGQARNLPALRPHVCQCKKRAHSDDNCQSMHPPLAMPACEHAVAAEHWQRIVSLPKSTCWVQIRIEHHHVLALSCATSAPTSLLIERRRRAQHYRQQTGLNTRPGAGPR